MKYRACYQDEETLDKSEFTIETDTVEHAVEAVRESISNFRDTDHYYCEVFYVKDDEEVEYPDFYFSKSDELEDWDFF